MYKPLLSLLLLFPLFIQAQKVLPEFDGIVSPEEWEGAETFKINYEIDPGNNVPSPHLTEVFITYSETDLYVGFIAYADMANSIRTFPFALSESLMILTRFFSCNLYSNGIPIRLPSSI